MIRRIFIFQATYFTITGIWSLVHLPSFMLVTGPKTDTWLVKMVGLLALSYGTGLFISLYRKRCEKGFFFSLLLACLSFAGIDLYYSLIGMIRPIYLIDAFFQAVFIWAIIFSLVRSESTDDDLY